MDFAYSLNGNAPHVKRYVVGESVANAGVPLTIDAAGETGLHNATTTSIASMVGVSIDTATYSTTQSGNSDIEAEVSVIINPDAIWLAKMSGAATENTSLAVCTVDTAASNGLTVETGTNMASPTFDEGVVWGLSGVNAGRKRKITSVSGNHATVIVPFAAISVGDTFARAPYWFMSTTTVQLTTNLYQADASIAVGTGAAFKVVDMRLNGVTDSFALLHSSDHVLNLPT